MRNDLHAEILTALKAFNFKEERGWLRQGECPQCKKRSLWINKETPYVLRCDRLNRCGYEQAVKEVFPELFNNWSTRYAVTEEKPNAAADAYLYHARRLDLKELRGAYVQEDFYSRELRQGSATVRFKIQEWGVGSDVSWWERLIDQPWRFGSQKARFAPGKSYAGHWWAHPRDTPAIAAKADEIWIVEGIFDALALREHGLTAFAALSSGNYPEKALARLRQELAGKPGPKLIWALDSDKAGANGIRKFFKRAVAEGWECGAAQIRQPDDGKKVDWNDLHLLHLSPPQDFTGALPLSDEGLDECLWRGDLLMAQNAKAKALLLVKRHDRATFPFDFDNQLWWAGINQADLAEAKEALQKEGGYDIKELHQLAIEKVIKISRIANCHPRPLYFQVDPLTDESWYFYRIEFPDGRAVKNIFTPAQISAAADFKKRLMGVSGMASFTGNTAQLDRINDQYAGKLRTVEAVNFVGYSREHGAYVFNEWAVKDGKVHGLNEDDYFAIGRTSVKSTGGSVDLQISPWDDNPDWTWLDDLWTAFGAKGLVVLTFWFGSLFAEQLRGHYASYPFLAMIGKPDTGKSTIIEFLWKLCGRQGYEGFDPSKATASARARNFAQVGNMPVVLMEGDRDQDTARGGRFDFNELKSLYNGRSTRSRGVRTSGNETYEPPFRGAVVIEQNHQVETNDEAIPTRLVNVTFDGSGYSLDTKAAADRLTLTPMSKVSGFILAAVRKEREVLAKVASEFPTYEKLLLSDPHVGHRRISKCHAQMMALLEALALVAPLSEQQLFAARGMITAMAQDRKRAIAGDHPTVVDFWDAYDFILTKKGVDPDYGGHPLNHARDHERHIAVNLTEFAALARTHNAPFPALDDLKRVLRGSQSRRFVDTKPVNSRLTGKTTHCWVFETTRQKSEDA